MVSRSHGRPWFPVTQRQLSVIDVPGAVRTLACGINDTGRTVGFFDRGLSQSHGFLYAAGTFATIDVPDGLSTEVVYINAAEQIVGQFLSATRPRAFLGNGGNISIIDVPSATITQAFGVNGAGEVVGVFVDKAGAHDFFDIGGSFTTIDVPRALAAAAKDVNDKRQIVGTFVDGGGTHGFLDTRAPNLPNPGSG
jgi:probable HAF family extracellular repeat protein